MPSSLGVNAVGKNGVQLQSSVLKTILSLPTQAASVTLTQYLPVSLTVIEGSVLPVLQSAVAPGGKLAYNVYCENVSAQNKVSSKCCAISSYEFSIYNRFGQRVFFSEDPAAKWDGTFAGIKQDIGTYMYYLKFSTGLYNIPHEMKGDMTLVR